MTNLNQNNILLDNHKLVYYEKGNGVPILFIHGISTYSFIWRKVAPYFINKYRVIVVDLLGCGNSDLITDISFGIANHARFMFMLTEKLGIKKFHLVSHDVGGGIAQVMSVIKPKVLLSVTLINTVAYDFWPVQPIISMRIPIVRQLAIATLDLWTLKLIVKRGLFYDRSFTSELLELFRTPFKSKAGRQAFLHFASCLNNEDLLDITDSLHQLDTNFLVIRGGCDYYLSSSIAEKLVNNLKKCESVIIPTAGHYAMEDEPLVISNKLLEFIKRHD